MYASCFADLDCKYLDTLMKDLGLNPYRKSNILAELFVRYRPSDYRGLLDEYLSSQGKKTGNHTTIDSPGHANGHGNGHARGNGHVVKASGRSYE